MSGNWRDISQWRVALLGIFGLIGILVADDELMAKEEEHKILPCIQEVKEKSNTRNLIKCLEQIELKFEEVMNEDRRTLMADTACLTLNHFDYGKSYKLPLSGANCTTVCSTREDKNQCFGALTIKSDGRTVAKASCDQNMAKHYVEGTHTFCCCR